ILWWNWVADAADVLDTGRPRDRQAQPCAAEVRRDLLGPLEWCVERPRPRDRHVRARFHRSPDIIEFELLGDGVVQDAIVRSIHIGRAERRTSGTRAVVAADVDDQRVVELALILDFLDDAADLVVGIGRVGGKYFGLSGKQSLFVSRQRLPLR